jgi:lipoate-protein ligase A
MAVDVALARTLPPGEGVLRIYEWSRPTVSFGRNQPARERFERVLADRTDVDVVRRPTGGREVLHDRELTYSIVAPLGTPARGRLAPRYAYGAITDAIAEALQALGVSAHVSPAAGRVPALESGPCFAAPGVGEIEVEGRKLVGSAQVRIGNALLQHGSLPLRPPIVDVPGLEFGGISVAEVLPAGPPGGESRALFDRLACALEAAVSAGFPGDWSRGGLTDAESEVAKALLPYYESPSWTWRR